MATDLQDLVNNDTSWVANMATGYARCLHRWSKGQEYSDAIDFAEGVEPRPVLTDQQALRVALKLQVAADILVGRIESEHAEVAGGC